MFLVFHDFFKLLIKTSVFIEKVKLL